MDASGVPQLDTPQAQDASESVAAIKTSLDRVTQKLMSDFFRDMDIFSAAKAPVNELVSIISTVKNAIGAGLIDAEEGTVPRLSTAAAIAHHGTLAYLESLEG